MDVLPMALAQVLLLVDFVTLWPASDMVARVRGGFAGRVARKVIKKGKSHVRMDAFTRGMTWGMHLSRLPRWGNPWYGSNR